ncbi:chitin-binding domain protein cbd-1-like [Bacillus rossius redtenbacheri]|uniref:chitin-binding domain protein cbd-1-like n=1 Tax=Bacillus rossius redtenbacheri TaxID=93214 RepID=UPI002FDD3358
MRGITAVFLAACALVRAQSGDGEQGIIPDSVVIACPLEEAEDSLVTILKNPSDCSKFYKCDHGLPVEKSCPKGLLFNDKLKVCDYPQNVDCSEVSTVAPAASTEPPTTTTEKPAAPASPCPAEDPQHGEAVIVADPDDASSFFICSWGVAYRQRCAPGLVFSSSLRVCDWPETVAEVPTTTTAKPAPQVSCPADQEQGGRVVILANEADNTSFYKCSWGVPHLFRCPLGLVFNDELKVCDWPYNVRDCPTGTSHCAAGITAVFVAACALVRAQSGDGEQGIIPDSVVIACPLKEAEDSLVTILKHPSDCSKFYKCDHGLPVEKSCPKGLLFNDKLKVCDYPQNVDCSEASTVAPEASTEPPITTTEKPAAPARLCPAEDPQHGEAVIVADPDDASSFFICSWGVAYRQRCAPGLVFSSSLRVCVWPETVAEVPTTTTAKPAPQVSCPADQEQGGRVVILANEADNTSFYKCSWGVPHLFRCPLGLVFNDELKVCDWP